MICIGDRVYSSEVSCYVEALDRFAPVHGLVTGINSEGLCQVQNWIPDRNIYEVNPKEVEEVPEELQRLFQASIPFVLDLEGQVTHVHLSFDASAWWDLIRVDGTFPPCCRSTSQIRSHLMGAMRLGGWIQSRDLRELCRLIRAHGQDSSSDQNRSYLDGAIDYLEGVRRSLPTTGGLDSQKVEALTSVDSALRQLSKLSLRLLVSRRRAVRSNEDSLKKKVSKAHFRAQVVPHLKTLQSFVETPSEEDSVEFWALINLEKVTEEEPYPLIGFDGPDPFIFFSETLAQKESDAINAAEGFEAVHLQKYRISPQGGLLVLSEEAL